MHKFSRALGASALALAVALGAAACGSASGSEAAAPGTPTAQVAEPVKHTEAEVKAVLDDFLAAVSKESDEYMADAMANGAQAEEKTPEENAAALKEGFPKSYKFLDMDDEKSGALVGMFAL